MKTTLFALISTLISCTHAAEKNAPPAPPQSLTSKLETHYAVAGEYTYNGKHVFLVKPTKCCDIPEMLYDKDGNKICMLGGGFANQTDEKCKDFKANGKLVTSFAKPKSEK